MLCLWGARSMHVESLEFKRFMARTSKGRRAKAEVTRAWARLLPLRPAFLLRSPFYACGWNG